MKTFKKIAAFAGCSSLLGIDIPTLTTLDCSIFKDCSTLTTIKLPKIRIFRDKRRKTTYRTTKRYSAKRNGRYEKKV